MKISWGIGITITIIVFMLISFWLIYFSFSQDVNLVSDDYYEADSIGKVMAKFNDPNIFILNGNCMMHYSDSERTYLDKSGFINTSRMLKYWKPYFCPPQPSIFFRKSVWDAVGPLNESLNYSMDLDLWLKMSLKFKFTFYNEVLSHYLIHESSKSGSEGGLKKFVPEWRKLAFKYLWKSRMRTQLSFWRDYLKNVRFQK